ncbi:type II secretion system F family protein [Candidatus Gracilibacteria bacterium]|nr:type II secretion system F family protein [Candidatus Gracilibacteria bacterium]
MDLSKVKKFDYMNYFKDIFLNKSIKISQKQKISFFESLFNLLSSGIPITNSLSILSYQTKDKNLKQIILKISKDLSKGKKMSESFADYQKSFSFFDIYMIKMGELTGKVSSSCESIKNREEKNAELKSKVIGALIYPMIVVSLSIMMIIGFMTFVIPKVQKMYDDAKVNLPSLTQNVINISEFLQNNYIILIIIFICLIGGLITFKNHSQTKIYFDKYVLKIPLFGSLIKKQILVVFTNTLGTLLQNGININEALDISKKSLNNAYYEKRIGEIISEISEGLPLSESMGIKKLKEGIEDDYFPIELASIVKIGEQTGKLPSLLLNIGNKFNREIDTIVKGLSTAIEPIVIIVVGLIVGTLVMAILLPFFNMVNVM